MRRSKTNSGSQKTRRTPLMMALEPRVMFDGAAAPTAHALHAEHHEGVLASAAAAPRVAAEVAGYDIDHLRQVTSPLRIAEASAAIDPARATEPTRLTAEPLRATTGSAAGPAVVFIDSRVQDPASLLEGVTPRTEIVTLQADSGGLQQIASYLSHHHEVSSVEIIAHGGAGDLLLGSTDVTAENVNSFARSLGEIGVNLRAGADILVYACNTAATARGIGFVDSLAKDTGHVVAASSNVTGAGGDWNLEIATGNVTAKPVLAKASEARYAYTLGTTAVSTAAQLNAAIAADDLDLLGNDTITLTSNITYASAADAVNITHLGVGTLTIDGGGHTINANYLSRVLTVTAGNVVLENVTLEHGLLAGAGGALSLNGVSELGAGIYNGGALTLINVNVTQNVATGGGGGGTGVVGAGGGGGGGAGGLGGASGGGIGAGAGSGSSGGKGSGTGGGLGGSSSGGGVGGSPALGGSPGGSGATATSAGLTVGGGGGGTGYVAGNGAAGGAAAGGIYNSDTGRLYVLGGTAITNNLGAGGGGGGGIGLNVLGALSVPFHGGVGGQGVGGIWNAPTGQVYITSSAYAAMTGNVGASGVIGSATGGGSNAGYASPTAAAKINTGSGTAITTYTPVAPVVSSISTVGSSPNNAASDSFTVNFSESVSGVNALDFSLANTGTVAGVITSVTGSGSSYTVTVAPVTGDGTMSLNFNPVTPVYDASGNLATSGYSSGQTYSIEHTPPVVSSITGPASNPNNLATDTFTVNFSEAVGGVDAADFTVAKTGTVGAGITSVTAVNPDANGRASSYTVTVGGTGGVGSVSGDGTLELNLNASGAGITDAAGNALLGGALGPVYGVEHTAPVVTSIDTVGSSTNNAASDAFTVTFSEPVSTPVATDFTLTNTGTAGGVITSILPVTSSGGNGLYSSYTVLVSPAFGDGTMRLNFYPTPSPIDAAGNPVGGSFTGGQTYTIEHTPPVATSIVATTGDSPSAGSEQFTANFSENVGGVDATDFTLSKTGTAGGSITSVIPVNPDANGRASAYTVTVSGITGIGTLQVALNATGTGITDAAGNVIVGGAAGPVYGVTHMLPTVSSIVLDDPATNNLASEQYTVNFSENVTGVNAADFSLTNSGTVGGIITSVTGSGSSYTVTVAPVVGDGTMRLDLNAVTTIVDASGNTTAGGYTSGPSYSIEHTPPVATSIVTVGANPNDAASDQYTVNFSEAVGGVVAGDFTLASSGTAAGSIGSVTAVNPDANGRATAYTVTLNNVTGNGTLQLNLNAAGTGISDAAGNAIVGGQLGEVYEVGHAQPVVTSIATVGASPNNAASDAFTVTFSEPVTGVTAGDFSLATSGSVVGAITSVTPVNPVNGAASSYTVIVGPVTGTGTLGLNFVSPVIGQPVDAYGNVTGGSFTGSVYGVDHTPPTAVSITAATGDGPSSTSDQFTVTFSKPVTGVDTADFALVAVGATGTIDAVTPVNPVNGAASTYTVSVDGIHGTGSVEVNLNATGTGITDVAGNALVGGALGTPYGVSVTAPSVTSITLVDPATNNLGTEQFAVNFSEAVGGVAAGDFVLIDGGGVSGSIASVTPVNPDGSGRASAYTVTVDNVVGTGTLRLDLSGAESGITDAGGNAASGGYSGGATYTIDHTAPEVSSIALVDAATNNATTEQFTVNFSENVGGVAAGDFVLTDSGGVTGTIASVTPVNPDGNGRASAYTVTVNNVAGNGTMRLDLNAAQSGISDAAGNSLSGGYTGGPSYTINHTAPAVSSVALVDAGSNNLSSEQFTVNFSENVGGVAAGDFVLTDSGSVTGSVAAVTAVNPDANGRASSYTVTVNNVTGDGTMRLDLSAAEAGITDAAGNTATGGYTGGPSYTIEHTPPTVTSVTAVNTGPSDSSTQVFTVDFSEGVTGVTAADFTAATSGSVGVGSITVAPTSPFSSSYTVTVNGVTGNGTLGLNVNAAGTGISDAAGNGIVGGFSTGAGVAIDNTPPAVTSIALVNAATNNLGTEQFTVTFSESVGGVTTGDFALTNGGTVAGTIASVVAVNPDVLGHSSTYMVTVNNVSGDGTMRLDLAAAQSGITDDAGNMASGGYTGGSTYTIEHTPPTVTSMALVGAATNNAGSEQFTVNFSENVGGVGIGDFALTNGGNVSGTITSVTAVNPDAGGRASEYTVTVSNVTGDGTMKLNLNAAASDIQDAAGNAATLGYSAGPTYTIEHTAPVVASINLVDAATNNLASEQFTVTFSEPVGGVTAGDFVLTDGGGVGGTIASVVAVNPDASGRASTYTVTVNDVTGDGTMRLELNAAQSGITDAAGNTVSGGYASGPAYTLEHTAPAVTSIALVDAATNNATTEQFTVNFSESVGGVTAGDFVLTNGGSVSGTLGAITAVNPGTDGRASSYTVTVDNVTGDGTMRLDVTASQTGISDAAGNAASGAYTAGPTYTLEHSAPVVSSISLVGNVGNDNASEQFTVNFSQSVGGVNAGDFTLATSGSVAGSITAVTPLDPDANGRASAYTVTVSGVSGAGTMRLDLGSSTTGISDAAGNALTAGYDVGPAYTLGTAVPAVESISVVGAAVSNASSEQFLVKFSEDVTGVGSGDFALTTTGTAAGTIAAVTGSGDTYTVTVDGVSGDGTLRLDLNGTGAGIVDAANHPLQSGFTAGQVVTLEHTPPAVTAIAAVGNSPNNAGTEQYTVTFSQDVSGVDAADFALVNGGSVAGVISSVTGSGHAYTVTVADVTGDGSMRLDLNAGSGIVDAAGNALVGGYAGQVITLEHSAPTVTSFTPVGTTANNAASEQFTITFSQDVTGVDVGDFGLSSTGTAAGKITSVTGSGTTYTVSVGDVTGDGTLQLVLNASASGITDAAGNHLGGGASGYGGASGPPITVQHTPPAVSSIDIIGANPNDAATEQFTVTFSEDVTGVAAGDFTLVGTGTAAGKITSVSGSGNTYVVTLSDVTGDGTLRLDLNASGSGIKDGVGNAIGAGFTAGQTLTVDHTAPYVEAVSAPPSSTYTAGETVAFTVMFDEPVLVNTAGGQPSIPVYLDSGGTHTATYSGGSGTNNLTFRYTVGPADQSPSGLTLGKTIALNGATLSDAVGNVAVLTLTNVAADGGVTVGGVTPQLPLPSAGADLGAAGGAGGSGSGAPQMPAYMGYVDNALYAGDDLATAQYLPQSYDLPPIVRGSVPVQTDVGDIAIDHSVQPPLSVSPLLEPVNAAFTFSVPVGAFQFDPGSVVVVNAAMADGRPLPAWLSFDPSSGRFKGIAPVGWNDHLHIIVSARDQNGRDVMLPVEVKFAAPRGTQRSVPIARWVPRTERHHAAAHASKESLAGQFARYGRHARERELSALLDRR